MGLNFILRAAGIEWHQTVFGDAVEKLVKPRSPEDPLMLGGELGWGPGN